MAPQPPENCKPKQQDCEKYGSGPGCSRANNLTGGASDMKAACLKQVEKDCEKTLTDCLKKCEETTIEATLEDLEEEEKRVAAVNADRAKNYADCQKSMAYQQQHAVIYAQNMYSAEGNPWSDINSIDGKLLALSHLGATQHPDAEVPQIPPENDGGGSGGNPDPIYVPRKWGDYYKHVGPDIGTIQDTIKEEHGRTLAETTSIDLINKAYVDLNLQRREEIRTLNRLCPPPQVEENALTSPEDTCATELARETNSDAFGCAARCFLSSYYYCLTVKCTCPNLHCNGYVGGNDSGVGNQPTNNPNTPGTSDPSDDPTKTRTVNITLSAYDVPIELVYGKHYMFGNILWVAAGDGTPTPSIVVTYNPDGSTFNAESTLRTTSKLNLFVGTNAGEIDSISRVWVEDSVVYDVSATSTRSVRDGAQLSILRGSESQKVLRDAVVNEGFGRVPAYRGIAGVYFKGLNIASYESFPSMRFEIMESVKEDPAYQATSPQPDEAADKVFHVDRVGRRVSFGTDDGVRTYHYDTLVEVADITVSDPILMTTLPTVLSYDGDALTMFEYKTDMTIATFNEMGVNAFFPYRFVNNKNEGRSTLLYQDGSDVNILRVEDIAGTFGVMHTLSGILTGTLAGVSDYRDASQTTSVGIPIVTNYMAVLAQDGPLVRVELVGLNSTATTFTPLEATSFDFEPFDDGLDVTVEGVYNCDIDDSLIIFVSSPTYKAAVKWKDGTVLWNTPLSFMPMTGGRANQIAARTPSYSEYIFIDDASVVHTLDLDTGDITLRETACPAVGDANRQFYDSGLGAIVYVSDTGALTKTYVNRIDNAKPSIGAIIKDVAKRAGVSPYLINSNSISEFVTTGYRSGENLQASSIIQPLLRAYSITNYSADRLEFVARAYDGGAVIQKDDVLERFNVTRRMEAYDNKAAEVAYYSEELLGEAVTQSFTLPDDVNNGATVETFKVNVLETNAYMSNLAELLVFNNQESDEVGITKLPPKYLAITAGDIFTFGPSKWRVSEDTIGADFSIDVETLLDDPTKYVEFVNRAGLTIDAYTDDIVSRPDPFIFAGPSMYPDFSRTSTIYISAANTLGELQAPTDVSSTSDEYIDSVGSFGQTFSRELAWGRLITPPPKSLKKFGSHPEQSFVVKMSSPEHAARLTSLDVIAYGIVYRNSPITYPLTFTNDRNLLLVGNEFIQVSQFSIAPDGVTVTCSGLLRYRRGTDAFVDNHVAGERVIVYSSDSLLSVDYTDSNEPYENHNFKGVVLGDLGEAKDNTRHRDVSAEPLFYRNAGAYSPTRFDDSGNIYIQYDSRTNIKYLSDDFVGQEGAVNANCQIYLLRADYDEDLFNMYKDMFFDTSYIIGRYVARQMDDVPDNSRGTGFGEVFYTYMQSYVGWTPAEPLVAVFTIEHPFSSFYGDSPYDKRIAVKWPSGNYTQRPMRGILQNA